MVMSVTTQIIFPYMSDAHRPAVDVQMAAQDACVPLSFWLILSAILIDGDGFDPRQGSTLGDGTGTWNLVTVCNDFNGRRESTEPEPGTWNPKPWNL